MGEYIGIGRRARRCYGFDEIAIVPGSVSIDPEDVDISFKLGDFKFMLPLIAAAMDGVVDVNFALEMQRLGGLAVLNLEGLQTRYKNPEEVIEKIINAPPEHATEVIQKVYREEIKEELIEERIKELKRRGKIACVSSIPQKAEHFGSIAKSAGVDIFVVQGTSVTPQYISHGRNSLDFKEFKNKMQIPVVVGNCVTYEVAFRLMECGVDGILVGIGPGTACTTRGVLGIGVPQITAAVDCAYARDLYYRKTNIYVPIIIDGGMLTAGDVCKGLAAGADAVMLGSAFAKTKEAPGKGYHWGMATPHRYLPRGTLIKVGTTGSLEEILYGPARVDDGSQNLASAIKMSLGMCGAKNIKEMHLCELIIAPSIQTEGKIFQKIQFRGIGKK